MTKILNVLIEIEDEGEVSMIDFLLELKKIAVSNVYKQKYLDTELFMSVPEVIQVHGLDAMYISSIKACHRFSNSKTIEWLINRIYVARRIDDPDIMESFEDSNGYTDEHARKLCIGFYTDDFNMSSSKQGEQRFNDLVIYMIISRGSVEMLKQHNIPMVLMVKRQNLKNGIDVMANYMRRLNEDINTARRWISV